MNYYVFYGFVDADQHDHESYKLAYFETSDQVLQFHEQWRKDNGLDCPNRNASQIVFKVIHGRALEVKPLSVVTEWCLER